MPVTNTCISNKSFWEVAFHGLDSPQCGWFLIENDVEGCNMPRENVLPLHNSFMDWSNIHHKWSYTSYGGVKYVLWILDEHDWTWKSCSFPRLEIVGGEDSAPWLTAVWKSVVVTSRFIYKITEYSFFATCDYCDKCWLNVDRYTVYVFMFLFCIYI